MIKTFGMGSDFWLATRLLFGGRRASGRKFLSTAGWISLFGLVIGVASLVVSMAVISGFEYTLWKSVTDVAGHIQLFKLNPSAESWQDLLSQVKKVDPKIEEGTRFAIIEGVMANKGKLSGIFIQGIDDPRAQKVLSLQTRIISGQYKLGTDGDAALALIGKGIANDFGLKIGDTFRVVVPVNTDLDVGQFHRHLGLFKVSGILDLGKYEYDQRWIFTSLSSAQALSEIGDRYSGLLLKTSDWETARESASRIARTLGVDYRVRDWHDINENLFSAVRFEKVAIFFVIFIIVLAAAFNVAISLYINVVRSTPEIAVLRAQGLTKKQLTRIFGMQGFLLGIVGTLLGFLLGLLFCWGFTFLENNFSIIPGSVYKVDHIELQIKFLDLLSILFATVGICAVATWAPARRAANMSVVEGLRHD